MAKKSLRNQTLSKINMLQSVAGVSREFNKEVSEETNVAEMTDEMKDKILYLEDDMLMDDPQNQEIYGETELEMLSESMKIYGFQGVILAYPYEGKYRIESGHRRRDAAKIAGITKYPVYITEAPNTDWDRKLRLIRANLHGRKETPMTKARVAQGLFEAHSEEIKYKKDNNLLEEGEITALNTLVAMDLEIDSKTVEKYRQLLGLIPELQEMADSGNYAWSALAGANTLDKETQTRLYEMILDKTDIEGPDSVKRSWIISVANQLKLDRMSEETKKTASASAEENPSTRVRRKNGTKIIMKTAKNLHEVLDNDSVIKKEEIPTVLQTLEDLKSSIENKIAMLQEIK